MEVLVLGCKHGIYNPIGLDWFLVNEPCSSTNWCSIYHVLPLCPVPYTLLMWILYFLFLDVYHSLTIYNKNLLKIKTQRPPPFRLLKLCPIQRPIFRPNKLTRHFAIEPSFCNKPQWHLSRYTKKGVEQVIIFLQCVLKNKCFLRKNWVNY